LLLISITRSRIGPSLRQRARSPVYIGSPGQKLGAFWAVPF